MAALLHARAVHARGLCATPSPSARAGPIINDVRHALFDRLEHELDWSGVDETLHHAVSTASPSLLPGDTEYSSPPLPIAPKRFAHQRKSSWCLKIAYYGAAFKGFAWQPESPHDTVSGRLDAAITPLLGGRRPRIACAGRTDAGVSALNQLVSFHSFPELTVEEIRDVVDGSSPDGSLRLLDAQLVPPSYHATFSTRWRRYVYLLPSRGLGVTSEDIHRQLAPLAGVRRDYAALGRGLPRGKDTSCHFHRASASAVTLPRLDDASLLPAEEAIRIELIADRFLRRQVRTLVSSAVWAAQMQSGQVELPPTLLGDEGPDGERLLLTMATSGLQEQTAHPAPARGLVFTGAGGEEDCVL